MAREEVEEAERSLDQALFLFGVIRDVYDDLPEDVRKLVRNAPIPHLGGNLVSLSRDFLLLISNRMMCSSVQVGCDAVGFPTC
jgi:hypothetical protein